MEDDGSLGLQIKAHWKAHRPRLYYELEEAGQLEASVSQAEEQIGDTLLADYRIIGWSRSPLKTKMWVESAVGRECQDGQTRK